MKRCKMYRIGIRQRRKVLLELLLLLIFLTLLIVLVVSEIKSEKDYQRMRLNHLQFSKMKKTQHSTDFVVVSNFGTGLGLVY